MEKRLARLVSEMEMEGEAKREREAQYRDLEKKMAIVRLEMKEGVRKLEEEQEAKKQVN